mgnify:CR=1 FL=1
MYTIEKDIPYKQTISACKYPELRQLCNEMQVGDSVVVATVKEATALQMYMHRRHIRTCADGEYGLQISRRKRVADEMGNTQGYRVWRLA